MGLRFRDRPKEPEAALRRSPLFVPTTASPGDLAEVASSDANPWVPESVVPAHAADEPVAGRVPVAVDVRTRSQIRLFAEGSEHGMPESTSVTRPPTPVVAPAEVTRPSPPLSFDAGVVGEPAPASRREPTLPASSSILVSSGDPVARSACEPDSPPEWTTAPQPTAPHPTAPQPTAAPSTATDIGDGSKAVLLGHRFEAPSFRSSLLRGLLLNAVIAAAVVSAVGPATLLNRLAFVVAVSLPFAHLAATNTLVRRVAVRSVRRRPRDAALLGLAVTLASAIITVPFVASDAFASSLDNVVSRRLGPVDAVIVSPDLSSGDLVARAIDDQIAANPSGPTALAPVIDGRLRALVAPATARVGDGPVIPDAQVLELDLGAAENFGSDPGATGLKGTSSTPLSPSGTLIAAELAHALGADTGSTITVTMGATTLELTVEQVLPVRGLVGFGLDSSSAPRNLIVRPGALAGPASRGAAPGVRSLIMISAVGRGSSGESRASTVVERLEAALQARVSGLGGVGGTGVVGDSAPATDAAAVTVVAVKADLRDRARRETSRLRDLFAAVGALGVLAAGLLVLNVVQFLAGDRLTESGTLRAVGLSRRRVVSAWALEGWALSLSGSIIGALIGYILARVVLGDVSVLAAAGDLPGSVSSTGRPASAVSGLAVGFALSLLCVVAGALWTTRVALGDALKGRGVAGPGGRFARIGRLAGTVIVLVAGVGITLWGWRDASPIALVLGPAIAGAALVAVLARWIPPQVSSVTVGVIVAAWAVIVPGWRNDVFDDAGPSAITIAGTVLTLAITAVVAPLVQVQARRRTRRRTKGTGATELASRLGAAEANAQPGRAVAVIASFAIVTFLLTLVTLLHASVSGRGPRLEQSAHGGYTFVARTALGRTIDTKAVVTIPGVRAAPIGEGTVLVAADTVSAMRSWRLQSVGNAYVSGGPATLSVRPPGAVDDAAVWKELVGPGRFAIISAALVEELAVDGRRLGPGDQMIVRDRSSDGSLTLRVLAISPVSLGDDAVIVSNATAAGTDRGAPPCESSRADARGRAGSRQHARVAEGTRRPTRHRGRDVPDPARPATRRTVGLPPHPEKLRVLRFGDRHVRPRGRDDPRRAGSSAPAQPVAVSRNACWQRRAERCSSKPA